MVMEGKGSTSALENSRSFWVVGKNWESPVHGERAAAPVLMSVEAFRSTWWFCNLQALRTDVLAKLNDHYLMLVRSQWYKKCYSPGILGFQLAGAPC